MSDIISNLATSTCKPVIDADSIDEDGLKKKIIKILLDDPDSDVKRMAEDYLIQCLYDSTEDPDKNPILHRFYASRNTELENLRNEVSILKSELESLKDFMWAEQKSDSYYSYGNRVAWMDDFNVNYRHLEDRLNIVIEKLGKAGIDINSWEN